MACFLVPTGEAIVVGIAKKVAESKDHAAAEHTESGEIIEHMPFSEKLGWLFKMLIGGAVLLAFEHLWHGEVVPFPPFLTAMYDPGDTAEMLHEMGTVGVTMAIIITAVWIGMVAVSNVLERKGLPDAEEGDVA